MSVFHRLIKILVISLSIFLFSLLLFINPADAKNITGGFGAGTTIATPKGDIPVEELKEGDRIIGYNFETHHTEENIVRKINQKTSLSYYLINHQIKLTGTSYVYVDTKENPKLISIHQLKLRARLFSKNHSYLMTNSVEQIVKQTDVYALVFENQTGNLYADSILVHNGEKIPNLLSNYYLRCKYGEGRTANYTRCAYINADTFPGFLSALAIVIFGIAIIGSIIAKSLIYIRNLIQFYGKSFTDNVKLVNFTKSVNPNFTNCYSIEYLKEYKVWCLISLQSEIAESEYQYLISKTKLIAQIKQLYIKYHRDLVNRKFSNISQYFPNFAIEDKYINYQKHFVDRFDIIYQPKILNIAILDFDDETNENITFKVQVNAEMINFVISQSGYVLTGEPKIQQYSEYWDIELTSDKQWCIQDIEATLTTQILSGDKRAKREAYANFTGA